MTHPTPNATLIGHDEAMRQVTEAFASGRMHHAWLLAGGEGIGKATLAYHIAHHVLSGGQIPVGKIDPAHRVARLIAGEAHPDMLVVRRVEDEKSGELRNVIVVQDALKIATFLHKTSTNGGWRVVLIDEAHTLNRHGQNAILKILEEPPSRVLILITTTTTGVLLPTIRSRCRVVHLDALNDAAMRNLLAQSNPELAGDELIRLISLSGGSIGFALKIVQTEALPLYEELLKLLDSMPQLDKVRLHKLADQMSKKADAGRFDVVTTLLVEHLRLSVRNQAVSGSPARLDRLLDLWEKTRATFALAHTANLDRKLAFVNAVSDIGAAMG